jgi:hypothetical protein
MFTQAEVQECFALNDEVCQSSDLTMVMLGKTERLIDLRQRLGLPLVFGGHRLFHAKAQRIRSHLELCARFGHDPEH